MNTNKAPEQTKMRKKLRVAKKKYTEQCHGDLWLMEIIDTR
jgi:hypothetical protein